MVFICLLHVFINVFMFVMCIYVCYMYLCICVVQPCLCLLSDPPSTHCRLEGERESRCVKLSQVHSGPSYSPQCHQLHTETKEFCFFSYAEFPSSTLSFTIYLYNVSNFIGICSYRLKRCTFVRATVNNVGAAHVIVNTKVKHRATEPLRDLLKLNTFLTKHFTTISSELFIVSIVMWSFVCCAADEAGVWCGDLGCRSKEAKTKSERRFLIRTSVWLFIWLWNIDIIKT